MAVAGFVDGGGGEAEGEEVLTFSLYFADLFRLTICQKFLHQ